MIVIGLTGGIGMGKSTAAKLLAGFGLPVYSADAAVHTALAKGGKGVKPVAKLFLEALKDGAIDRAALGRLVFGKPRKLKQLEAILHPLARAHEKSFLKDAQRHGARAAVLEIPLLFETGGEARCDIVLCVSAPAKVRQERVLQRKGMDRARFKAIVARQMSDREKRRRADYIIGTGVSRADTKRQLAVVLKKLGVCDA